MLNKTEIKRAQARMKELKKLQAAGALVESAKISRKDEMPGGKLKYSMVETTNNRAFVLYPGKAGGVLGQGGFGRVKVAQEVGTNQWYAVKITSENNHKEIEIMKDLGLVRGQAILNQPKQPTLKNKRYVFMNIAKGDNLDGLLRQSHKFDLKTTVELALSACRSVEALHQKGYVHRDIKPDNMVVDLNTKTITLIDYGFSTHINETIPKGSPLEGSTPLYLAPEDREMSHASTARDKFALGLTLGALMVSKLDSLMKPLVADYVNAKKKQVPYALSEAFQASLATAMERDLRWTPFHERAEKSYYLEIFKGLTYFDRHHRIGLEKVAIERLEKLQAIMQAQELIHQILKLPMKADKSTQATLIEKHSEFEKIAMDPNFASKAQKITQFAHLLKEHLVNRPLDNKIKQALNELCVKLARFFGVVTSPQPLFTAKEARVLKTHILEHPKIKTIKESNKPPPIPPRPF